MWGVWCVGMCKGRVSINSGLRLNVFIALFPGLPHFCSSEKSGIFHPFFASMKANRRTKKGSPGNKANLLTCLGSKQEVNLVIDSYYDIKE